MSYKTTKQYRSIEKNRVKRRARRRIEYLVSCGKLKKKPCEKCGKNKSEAHHPDYAEIDLIIWFCRKHHLEAHGGTFLQKKLTKVLPPSPVV